MTESINDHMKKIARGTGIAVIGMSFGLILQFMVRLIIARIGTEANYGEFYLAMTIAGIVVILASLGLQEGTTRYVAYLQGKNDQAKTAEIIIATLQLSVAASIVLCVAFFILAEPLALKIFHTPDLVKPFQLFSFTVPFLTLLNILPSVFRGFGRIEAQAFAQSLQSLLFLLLLLPIALLSLSFNTVFYVYLASMILGCIVLTTYSLKKLPELITITEYKINPEVTKELLIFSLPLLGTAVLSMLTLYTDTIALGYFKTQQDVGLYNAAYPLAFLITVPYTAFLMIFTPVASNLYSQNMIGELRRGYFIITKWICSVTLPIFLVLLFFPETVVDFIFGRSYVSAANALSILSIGFMLNSLLGPNVGAMLAIGHSRFLMWSVLISALSNIVLSVMLIPSMGITGAAISSAFAMVLANSLISLKLFLACRIQPFSKNLLKPFFASLFIILLLQFTLGHIAITKLWILPLLFATYYVIYGIAVILTQSFDKEDIAMLSEVDKMIGINTEFIKRALRKFIRV